MKHFFSTFLCLVAASAIVFCSCSNDTYVTIQGYAQGGTYHVICKVPQGMSADLLTAMTDSTLNSIDFSLSGYNHKSLLSRINAGEDAELDTLFAECFAKSKEVWSRSNGLFDPSAAPLFDLWGFGFDDRGEVSQQDIDSIKEFIGMDKLSLEEKEGKLFLKKEDARSKLNFNAIAQGFSCDVIAENLNSLGCTDYLVEVGREIVCKGKSARGGAWRVGLDKPIDGNMDEGKYLQTILEITDCGIVTSGNYRKFYVENGQKFSHTIDPVSGRPVQHNLLSATVIARDASTADAYATWFMAEGLDNAREIASADSTIKAYLIYADADSMRVWTNINSSYLSDPQ